MLWDGGRLNSPPKASVFNKFGILPTGPLNEMIWSMEHFLFLSPNILRDRHRTYCLATMIQQLTYVRVKKTPENFRLVILILTFKTYLRTASSVIFALKKIRLAAALNESWDTLGHKGCTGWTLHNGGLVGHIWRSRLNGRQPSSHRCDEIGRQIRPLEDAVPELGHS